MIDLLDDVEHQSKASLVQYALQRAELIVRRTQGDSWDDPEDYMSESVELAHAFVRMMREGMISDLLP